MSLGFFEAVGALVIVLILLGVIGGTAARRTSGGGRRVPIRREDGSLVLARIPERGALSGVCAGFAYHFSWPVWVARFIAMALVIAGGSGILVYIVLWLLMPVAEATPSDFDARTT